MSFKEYGPANVRAKDSLFEETTEMSDEPRRCRKNVQHVRRGHERWGCEDNEQLRASSTFVAKTCSSGRSRYNLEK